MFNKVKKLISILAERDRLWLRALARGVAAGIEHRSMLRGITPPDLVLDVGANRGQFSLMASRSFPDAKIVAFEPLQGPASCYREIFSPYEQVQLIEAAAGSTAKRMQIHIAESDDSSSLLTITKLQTSIFPGTGEVSAADIKVAPIPELTDSLMKSQNALLKIDVQGFELEVLRGCGDQLKNCEWVYCECSFVHLYENQPLLSEIVSWMAQRSFAIAGIYNLTYNSSKQPVQGDVLFRRQTEYR